MAHGAEDNEYMTPEALLDRIAEKGNGYQLSADDIPPLAEAAVSPVGYYGEDGLVKVVLNSVETLAIDNTLSQSFNPISLPPQPQSGITPRISPEFKLPGLES